MWRKMVGRAGYSLAPIPPHSFSACLGFSLKSVQIVSRGTDSTAKGTE